MTEQANPTSITTSAPPTSAAALVSLNATSPKVEFKIFEMGKYLAQGGLPTDPIIQSAFAAYERIFDESERYPRETILARFKNPEAGFTYSFNCLVDQRNPSEVVGIAYHSIINTGSKDVPWLVYLGVTDSHRGGGWGTKFLKEVETIIKAQARPGTDLLLTCHLDAYTMTPVELEAHQKQYGFSPQDRKKFWQKHSYQMVDAPYVYIPANPNEQSLSHYGVSVKALTDAAPHTISTVEFLKVVNMIHSRWLPDPLSDTRFKAYADRFVGRSSLPFIDLLARRSFGVA